MTLISSLTCHPATPCAAVKALTVGTTRLASGDMRLRFELTGAVDALRIPAAAHPGFADALWQHTCFEAFVSAGGSLAYREFNFSPSGEWAAYAFTAYRQRDTAWLPEAAPDIVTHLTPDGLVLEVTIPVACLPETGNGLQIGLTAVVETRDGHVSYWALAHTSERPDFHQRAAFTLHLAPPAQP